MSFRNQLNGMLNDSFSNYRVELMGGATIWIGLMHVFSELFPFIEIPIIGKIIDRGNLGVEIFLALSGYGLYHSLEKSNGVLHFYKKRANRILGAWLILGMIYWVLFGILTKRIGLTWLIYNFSGLSFWGSGVTTIWYVSYICIIYLLYPLVYEVQQKKSSSILVIMCGIILLNIILSVLDAELYSNIEIAITRTPVFLMGSYIAQNQNSKQEFTDKRMWTIWCYVLLMSCLFFLSPVFQHSNHDIAIMLYRYGGGGITIIIIIVLTTVLKKLHLNSFLAYYGRVSLEFYLISVFTRNIVALFLPEADLSYWLCILVSLSIFFLSSILAGISKRVFDNIVFFDVTNSV